MNFSESQTSKKENYNSYQKSVWRKTLTQSAFCFQNYYKELYKKKKSGIYLKASSFENIPDRFFLTRTAVLSESPGTSLKTFIKTFMWAYNFTTKRLQYSCFLVNFAKFFRCFTEHSVNGSFLVLISVFFNENFTKAEFCFGYFLGRLPTP